MRKHKPLHLHGSRFKRSFQIPRLPLLRVHLERSINYELRLNSVTSHAITPRKIAHNQLISRFSSNYFFSVNYYVPPRGGRFSPVAPSVKRSRPCARPCISSRFRTANPGLSTPFFPCSGNRSSEMRDTWPSLCP